MKLLTFPFKLVFALVEVPIKVLLATLGFGVRTGAKATALPFRGGYRAGRALGLKAIVLFVGGVAVGVVIGRRIGAVEAEDAASLGMFGSEGGAGTVPTGVTTVVEDSLAVVDTPDGPVVAVVEDTVEVAETPDGEVVTETVSVTEVEAGESAEQAAEQELTDEIEAEVDRALGNTGGELGVDVGEGGAAGGADV